MTVRNLHREDAICFRALLLAISFRIRIVAHRGASLVEDSGLGLTDRCWCCRRASRRASTVLNGASGAAGAGAESLIDLSGVLLLADVAASGKVSRAGRASLVVKVEKPIVILRDI